jgi:hypothetical protein
MKTYKKLDDAIATGGKVVAAALVGAAAGATAVALANKDTREKIQSTTKELIHKAKDSLDEAKEKGEELQERATGAMQQIRGEVQKKSAKLSTRKGGGK